MPLQHAAPMVLKRIEARRRRRHLPPHSRKSPCRRPRHRPPHQLHRRLPPRVRSPDFELLEEFVKEAKFDWLGVFNYSDEEGSAAHSLDTKIPKRTIESRRPPPDEAAAIHLSPIQAELGGPQGTPARRRRKRRNSASLGSPHPVPRPRDRRQSLHQRLWLA